MPQIETAAYVGTGRRSQRGGPVQTGLSGVIRREDADVNVITKRFHRGTGSSEFQVRTRGHGSCSTSAGQPLVIIAVDVYVNKPTNEGFSILDPDTIWISVRTWSIVCNKTHGWKRRRVTHL
jgi:hypothetical protein